MPIFQIISLKIYFLSSFLHQYVFRKKYYDKSPCAHWCLQMIQHSAKKRRLYTWGNEYKLRHAVQYWQKELMKQEFYLILHILARYFRSYSNLFDFNLLDYIFGLAFPYQ